MLAYSASKAALHTLTECLAQELVERGIKVNCLALRLGTNRDAGTGLPGLRIAGYGV
jgi:NAD(P)-dependent dehydrogenase (short-subunit alcohol dehydrogenase family)